jgi:hypothetical protein
MDDARGRGDRPCHRGILDSIAAVLIQVKARLKRAL